MSLIPDGGDTTTTETTETTQQTTDTTVDTTTDTTQETTETTETTSDGEVKFLFADGVGGEGEAPEWFKGDKYKTVSDQAKAYTELESRFGAFTGAPKDGKYEIEGMDFEESPLLKLTAEWGAENQLSTDGLKSLIEKVNGLAQEQIEQDSIAAREALGENADKRLNDLSEWGKNNLSPEEFEQFQGLAQNAGQVEVLEKILAKTKNSKLVDTSATPTTQADTEGELKKMQLATNERGQRLMEVDPAYRAKVTKKMQEFYK
jgi:hypothetical protein